ncbi:hypothetical protein TresaDRAFT_2812 [Treponema saccharophilum DSM 2985]|uniref:Uncharacterized protein n=1 Tax=Treponema saccharophilum DSM 2985 TaxID=907348 RepID=H7EGW2_9SPIR|nr:hypothetical protein TresaDRAFT_2812 [Treponema saccharophilum DSM 2985]
MNSEIKNSLYPFSNSSLNCGSCISRSNVVIVGSSFYTGFIIALHFSVFSFSAGGSFWHFFSNAFVMIILFPLVKNERNLSGLGLNAQIPSSPKLNFVLSEIFQKSPIRFTRYKSFSCCWESSELKYPKG